MNARHTFLTLLLVLLAAACREETSGGVEPLRDITQCFNAEGKAWLSIDLSLMGTGGTTRAANGNFADGDAAEYAVKTLTLVLFHGTGSEDDMQVASTYTIDYGETPDSHQQVTRHTERTLQITSDNVQQGDRLALMAVANAAPDLTEGTTFGTLKNTVLNSVLNNIGGTDYYVMASAPTATTADGTGSVTTLLTIGAADLYPTAEEAANAPAGHLFLERAAAKLTVDTAADMDYRIAGNTDLQFEKTDLYYSLLNYNTKTFLVRHFAAAWLPYNAADKGWRFTEQQALAARQYRTYWAEDVNYTSLATTELAYFKGWKDMAESDYCAENTFDVAHMTSEHTTHALIILRLNGGQDFYTVSTTGSDVIYQEPATTLEEEGSSANESFAPRRSSVVGTAATIDAYLRQWLVENNDALRNWVKTYAAGARKHICITPASKSEQTGMATFTVTQTAQAAGSAGATAFAALNLDAYLAANVVVNYYYQGYCYYRVPIRHFGDELTPWASATGMTARTAAQAYGGNEANYLGRYGMVRNNWYQVSIRSITHVGSPVAPALTANEADDDVEQLLNTTLNIDGWERHDQTL